MTNAGVGAMGAESIGERERRVHRWAFIAIFAIGAVLRFWNITSMGPFLYDDAIHQSEARWMLDVVHRAEKSLELKREEARTGEDLWKFDHEAHVVLGEAEGRPLQFGRPGISILIFLVMLVLGPVAYAGNLTGAICGTFIPIAVFLMTRRMFGSRAALGAMFFAALNGLQLFYDRSGLGETPSILLAALGVWCHVASYQARSERQHLWVFGAGFFWGSCVLMQSRWLTALALPALMEVVPWVGSRKRSFQEYASRALMLAFATFLPLVLMELVFYGAILVCRHFGIDAAFRTYTEMLIAHLIIAFARVGMPSGKESLNQWMLPYAFWIASGPLFILAFLGGVVKGLKDRTWPYAPLAFWILWTAVPPLLVIIRPRYVSLTFPAMEALAGVGLAWLWTWASAREALPAWRRHAAVAFVAIAAVVGLWRNAEVLRDNRQGYVAAMHWLDEQGARHLMFQPPMGVALRGKMALDIEPDYQPEALWGFVKDDGVRYWIDDIYAEYIRAFTQYAMGWVPAEFVDMHETFRGVMRLFAFVDDLREQKPVFSAPNPFATSPLVILEMGVSLRDDLKFLHDVAPKHATVDVYDLKAYLDGIDRGEIVPRWRSIPPPKPKGGAPAPALGGG
ncbi:MAG: glycosyltransferase family 39 protein [Myxococcales bacterium]|nr:glycosyltransferase family 39 protein [Myxococcales bacterium]